MKYKGALYFILTVATFGSFIADNLEDKFTRMYFKRVFEDFVHWVENMFSTMKHFPPF